MCSEIDSQNLLPYLCSGDSEAIRCNGLLRPASSSRLSSHSR